MGPIQLRDIVVLRPHGYDGSILRNDIQKNLEVPGVHSLALSIYSRRRVNLKITSEYRIP